MSDRQRSKNKLQSDIARYHRWRTWCHTFVSGGYVFYSHLPALCKVRVSWLSTVLEDGSLVESRLGKPLQVPCILAPHPRVSDRRNRRRRLKYDARA